MQQTNENPAQALMQMVNGYQMSQAIHAAAMLGIADLLRDGARGCNELASATGTDPSGLYRLLRALGAVGVFERGAEPDIRSDGHRRAPAD